jgi:sugar phosphate isomerase/epimerase
VTEITLAVFTKPWVERIEMLADKIAGLGLEGIELPIRPGYQVTPETVATALPVVRKALESRGLVIRSVAAPLDDDVIRACGDNGVQLVRTMIGIDLSKASFAETIAQHRARYDALIPLLDRTGVSIGVQNHSGNCIGSAIGLYHLMEAYDRKHVCAILDMAHCGIAGEPMELAVDLLWARMSNVVNFKNSYRERINGPEEAEAEYRTHWTTGPHGAYSWAGLVKELNRRGFSGTFCLPAEYTDPKGQPQRMGDDVLPFLKADIAYLRGLVDARQAA